MELSIGDIKQNPGNYAWFNISVHQTLSEPFIREFQGKLNWSILSAHQTLSEAFIRKFQDKLNIGVFNEVLTAYKNPTKSK